ncbi:DnaT-like ssDNA-binding domain-containing protein, partial [Gammaproteobacteria bacterium]|nr:DnaT-like ssDNA-binding domain-containing protein [Gammaproteobacteria bacterium]
YWLERGQERNNWNTSYIDYIRREWAKEKSSNRGLPFTLDSSWTPSEDVFDILELSEISKESASKYLREFILYWKENGSAFTTWNSKFIEHVKRRHLGSQNTNNEESKKHSEPGKYSKDFATRREDSSWASEIEL